MKQKTLALMILLALSLSGVASIVAHQATIVGNDSTALSATRDVLEVVSKLRALPIKSDVKAGLKSRDQIEQTVVRDLNESTTPQEFEATSKTLLKFGLVPRGFQLRDCVVKLLREQVAGFYEPKSGEFFLAGWLPLPEQKPVMAHELTHALQDQHFNLRRFEHWPRGDSDAELAAHALVEGDATIVMLQYSANPEGTGRALDVTKMGSLTNLLIQLTASEGTGKYPVLAAAPLVVRETLQFPYFYGVGFVQEVLKNGSTEDLNETYTRLPRSSEHIIHPDRYLTGDDPVKITLPSMTRVLGPKWKEIDNDVNGEFGLRLVLSQFIDAGKSRDASTGWGGDRYVLFEEQGTAALLVAQYTTWDTEADAREFFDAFGERTGKRYAGAKPSELAATRSVLRTSEGLVSIELRGKDVVVIEGASTRPQLQRLSRVLWQGKKST